MMTNEERDIDQLVDGKTPFRVPEGYFEQLTMHIVSQLPAEPLQGQQKPATLYCRLRPLLYVAACLLLAVLSVTVYLADTDEGNPRPLTSQNTAADVSLDDVADYAMVDNNDIYACLTSD